MNGTRVPQQRIVLTSITKLYVLQTTNHTDDTKIPMSKMPNAKLENLYILQVALFMHYNKYDKLQPSFTNIFQNSTPRNITHI